MSSDVLQQLIEDSTADENSFAVLFDDNHLHLAHSDEQTAGEVNYKLLVRPENPGRLTELLSANRVPNLPVAELSTDLPDLDQSIVDLGFVEDVAQAEQFDQSRCRKRHKLDYRLKFRLIPFACRSSLNDLIS